MFFEKNERYARVSASLAFALLLAAQSATARGLEIESLSSRADLVSGGDVLIEITPPRGTQSTDLELTLNGKDVSSQVKADAVTGHFVGLVGGLTIGSNTLSAKLKSRPRINGELTVTNHPITGPILSGPHLTPYECRTVESGLGEPLDANCSLKPSGIFLSHKDGNLTLAEVQASPPFPIWQRHHHRWQNRSYWCAWNRGTVNRTIYRLAVLDEPPRSRGYCAPYGSPRCKNRRLAVSFVLVGMARINQRHQSSHQCA